jgi:hypothetical protein
MSRDRATSTDCEILRARVKKPRWSLISFKGKLPPWHRLQKWGGDLESNQMFCV